jgi:cardiolipin synthase (CMP-forming)
MSTPTVAAPTPGRVVTVPNVISVIRLCCLPLFLWLLFGRDSRVSAALLLGGLGATDWIDGWIARRYGQVSELGKVLDPTADRLLFLVGVGAMIVDGSVPAWFAWAVLLREAVVSVVLVVLWFAGMKRFDVSRWGKAGTFALMFSFPMFLMAAGVHGTAATAWRTAAWAFGLPGLALSYYAAWGYVPQMQASLAAGRRERAAP